MPLPSLTEIGPQVLRHYYEQMYGRVGPHEDAFRDATFEEYDTLLRITYPDISRRRAAIYSKRPQFRRLAETFPVETGKPGGAHLPNYERAIVIRRQPEVDLRSAQLDKSVEDVLLDRIRSLKGWTQLEQLKRLQRVICVLCATTERAYFHTVIALRHLEIKSCNSLCLRTLAHLTNAEKVVIEHLDSPSLDLRVLKGHSKLKDLRAAAPLVRGAQHIAGLPLERLVVSGAEVDEEFQRMLTERKSTLFTLWVDSENPFGPKVLHALPALRHLKVPAFSECRSEWIEFAVRHPQICCEFTPLREPFFKGLKVSVADIYQGLDILHVVRGKKVTFEVCANVAGDLLKSDKLDNHIIGDFIQNLVKKEKRKVEVTSSADEVLIRASSIDDCRYCIDHIVEHFRE